MSRIFLGSLEHWLILAGLMAAVFAMGPGHLHVRAFSTFAILLQGFVVAALALVVWRYRPGDEVTRESFEDAALPHEGREEEEV